MSENTTMTQEDLRALINLTEKRMSTYFLLARLYRVEIDQEFLDELRTMRFPVGTGNTKVDEGYRLMAKYLSNLWENSVTDLAIDYVRTFIGHGVDAFSASYPFESVYTSKKRLLMQEARDEVLAIYRSAGLSKLDTWKESEDHIALELEFMQILCKRAIEALEANDEDSAIALFLTQKNFLDDHLAAWVPMMTSDIKRFAQTDLYQGLAFLTEGFLDTEQEFLADLLQDAEDNAEAAN